MCTTQCTSIWMGNDSMCWGIIRHTPTEKLSGNNFGKCLYMTTHIFDSFRFYTDIEIRLLNHTYIYASLSSSSSLSSSYSSKESEMVSLEQWTPPLRCRLTNFENHSKKIVPIHDNLENKCDCFVPLPNLFFFSFCLHSSSNWRISFLNWNTSQPGIICKHVLDICTYGLWSIYTSIVCVRFTVYGVQNVRIKR